MFTKPEVTNCFSKIALVLYRENKTKTKISVSDTSTLILKSCHCHNHLAVIIARENEVLDQSARAIFDNHKCNFLKWYYSLHFERVKFYPFHIRRLHMKTNTAFNYQMHKFICYIIFLIFFPYRCVSSVFKTPSGCLQADNYKQ